MTAPTPQQEIARIKSRLDNITICLSTAGQHYATCDDRLARSSRETASESLNTVIDDLEKLRAVIQVSNNK